MSMTLQCHIDKLPFELVVMIASFVIDTLDLPLYELRKYAYYMYKHFQSRQIIDTLHNRYENVLNLQQYKIHDYGIGDAIVIYLPRPAFTGHNEQAPCIQSDYNDFVMYDNVRLYRYYNRGDKYKYEYKSLVRKIACPSCRNGESCYGLGTHVDMNRSTTVANRFMITFTNSRPSYRLLAYYHEDARELFSSLDDIQLSGLTQDDMQIFHDLIAEFEHKTYVM